MVRKRSRGDDDSGKRSKRRTPGDPVVKQEPGGPNPAAGAAELGKDPSVKPEPGDARMGATPDWEELDSFGDPSPFPKWTRPLPEEWYALKPARKRRAASAPAPPSCWGPAARTTRG